jgi:hypothetical protein
LKKINFQEARQLYYERNSEISQQFEQITSQIKQTTADYINELNKRTTQFVQYLENICNDKRLHIKRKTLQINEYFKKFNHSCKIVDNAIKSSNDMGILLSKGKFELLNGKLFVSNGLQADFFPLLP